MHWERDEAAWHAQVESALQVQKLKPTIEAIKAQYGDDKKAIQRETSALYEASGVSPTAGEPLTIPPAPSAVLACMLQSQYGIWSQ